ncbi:helix-turn-helix transcriptional regulator [Paraburkholderia sp. BR10936]|uniref:helix-turn-helix transcriptional regulator n=1 Tax=Paraburkholderia sp. BR10936 TaxID=3236993 RepID=UPI0034D3680F
MKTVEFYTPEEIAEKLRVNRRTFMRTISTRPDFPAPFKLSKRIFRWERDVIDQWILRNITSRF